jgi:hypothetical protein
MTNPGTGGPRISNSPSAGTGRSRLFLNPGTGGPRASNLPKPMTNPGGPRISLNPSGGASFGALARVGGYSLSLYDNYRDIKHIVETGSTADMLKKSANWTKTMAHLIRGERLYHANGEYIGTEFEKAGSSYTDAFKKFSKCMISGDIEGAGNAIRNEAWDGAVHTINALGEFFSDSVFAPLDVPEIFKVGYGYIGEGGADLFSGGDKQTIVTRNLNKGEETVLSGKGQTITLVEDVQIVSQESQINTSSQTPNLDLNLLTNALNNNSNAIIANNNLLSVIPNDTEPSPMFQSPGIQPTINGINSYNNF